MFYIHIYQHASGHQQKEVRRVYLDSEEFSARENHALLGGELIEVEEVSESHRNLVFKVMESEISEAIDGNSYPGIAFDQPDEHRFIRHKAELMENLRKIYYGEIDPVAGVWQRKIKGLSDAN